MLKISSLKMSDEIFSVSLARFDIRKFAAVSMADNRLERGDRSANSLLHLKG